MTQPIEQQKKGFFLFRYFSEIFNELKKVIWLKWPREVLYLSGMVLIVVVIAGIFLGALDFGFSELVSRFFIG